MSNTSIGIVDYNTGNIHSIKNTFSKINVKAHIVSTPKDILNCNKILLPGVGAYKDAMSHLRESGIDEAIKEFANTGKYLLGICLGAQLLFDKSYEFGESRGLGLIKGEVAGFDKQKTQSLKIPHMGWNTIRHNDNPLFKDLKKDIYCYFVHSFHIQCESKYIIGETDYGYSFASAIQKDNILGLQPHPEKSHDNGLKILENFASL